MSYIPVKINTATWLPFLAADVDTGTPRTGITYTQVIVTYKKSSQASFQSKSVAANEFRENGNGVYEVLFSSAELNTLGTFIWLVNGAPALPNPDIRQSIGQGYVVAESDYTPGTISLPTNVLTGNLIDLVGNPLVDVAISARILSAPSILGVAPNRGGVSGSMITVRTDASGFFALELLQEAVVDIVIPYINYRRTLEVPANSTDKLFELP